MPAPAARPPAPTKTKIFFIVEHGFFLISKIMLIDLPEDIINFRLLRICHKGLLIIAHSLFDFPFAQMIIGFISIFLSLFRNLSINKHGKAYKHNKYKCRYTSNRYR